MAYLFFAVNANLKIFSSKAHNTPQNTKRIIPSSLLLRVYKQWSICWAKERVLKLYPLCIFNEEIILYCMNE